MYCVVLELFFEKSSVDYVFCFDLCTSLKSPILTCHSMSWTFSAEVIVIGCILLRDYLLLIVKFGMVLYSC